ncbi:MAG UNVERIFIED_CONTAM: hypothetical protein LVQ98_07120 [Rickettsiaceae bacterium]|jgi:F0F1-type ATP synthase membrane subunit b/b'
MLDENAYLAICFVIFIALSYKPIKSIILSFLDEKIKQIKWALEHASLAKETAEKELSEMQKHMHFIEKKHKDMLEAATIAIENEFKERSKKLAANLKYLENTAASRIQQIHREKHRKMLRNKYSKKL